MDPKYDRTDGDADHLYGAEIQPGVEGEKSEGEGELDTAQLVTLLNKDRALLTPEDSQKVSGHFRSKVKRTREEARLEGLAVNYADLIRSVLDYRDWYEFHLFFYRGDSGKKELTDRAFNRFSGGEKGYGDVCAAVRFGLRTVYKGR